jgi:hypothetical protein
MAAQWRNGVKMAETGSGEKIAQLMAASWRQYR